MTTTTPAPTGFGSVHGVPGLPNGFTSAFSGTLVNVDGVNLHVVSGGSGPVVLLVGGWPQFWYQWRLVMPALAEHFTVLAVDPREAVSQTNLNPDTIPEQLHSKFSDS